VLDLSPFSAVAGAEHFMFTRTGSRKYERRASKQPTGALRALSAR
jgi:hypothetical protein